MMVVLSLSTTTRLERPSCSSFACSSFRPNSSAMTWPPVTREHDLEPGYVLDYEQSVPSSPPVRYSPPSTAASVLAGRTRHVLLRRAVPKDGVPAREPDSDDALERGELRIDPERHTCTWKNEPVILTVTEFLILQALASRPGVVKNRNALMDVAYGEEGYVDDRTIDSHIKRLRKKFRARDVDFDMVETLYGIGYRFKEI